MSSLNIEDNNYLIGRINRQSVRCLLDTGSYFSILKQSIANKLKLKIKPPRFDQRTELYAANGSTLHVVGYAEVVIYFGAHSILHEFTVISNIDPLVLLGVDFLRENAMILDYSNSLVSFNGIASAPIFNHSKKVLLVKSSKTQIIPPFCEHIVHVKVSNRFRDEEILITPIAYGQGKEFSLAPSVSLCTGNATVCRILNTNSRAVVIPKHKSLAWATLI